MSPSVEETKEHSKSVVGAAVEHVKEVRREGEE
jgi:hypothetical protein